MKTASLLVLLLCGLVTAARAEITIRLDVKAVLNPNTGARQPGVTDADFAACFAEMDAMLRSFGRGYRLQWNGNALQDVGGLNQNSGPSFFYDIDFHDEDTGAFYKDLFETSAMNNPATYGWDSGALNIYITRYGGANWNVCSFPGDGKNILIVNGAAGYRNSSTVLHEIGHYFNLSHTFNGRQNLNANGTSCTNGCNCSLFIGGGEDGVADTILDHDCWDSQNDIASGNFGLTYGNLSASQTANVDNMWWNLMSYHNRQHTTDRFTPDQMDRWTDAANDARSAVRTGRTRFVATTGNDLFGTGSSTARLRTVARAVTLVNDPDDIVLIRSGNYNEPQTITKALTLRATRGDVLIGR